MAKCDYCGTTILFGGKRVGEFLFCNDKCYESGQVVAVAQQIPTELVGRRVREVHQGLCPTCKGNGPVDVHISYTVWSALVMTRFGNKPQVCCRSCGRKRQLQSMLFSLFLGWWGFPWGLIMTPVQVARNLVGIFRKQDVLNPSVELEKIVRAALASQALEAHEANTSQPART